MTKSFSAEEAYRIASSAGPEYISKNYGHILSYVYNQIDLIARRGGFHTTIHLFDEYVGIPHVVRKTLTENLIDSLRNHGYNASITNHFVGVIAIYWDKH